jgi:hypothetical protein
MAARKQASGVWEEGKKVGESPPIADAFTARNHTRERKEEEEGNKGRQGKWRYGHYLPRSSSSDPTLRAPSPAPVAV